MLKILELDPIHIVERVLKNTQNPLVAVHLVLRTNDTQIEFVLDDDNDETDDEHKPSPDKNPIFHFFYCKQRLPTHRFYNCELTNKALILEWLSFMVALHFSLPLVVCTRESEGKLSECLHGGSFCS